ncbi:All-trans-phytoene synthase [Arthrobacter saudimassiliensis]|uniref:All-trans-phytoene synthase n=1 Tax=Arthrobacter saudimassiliensis TaxID=1461584 RepID=A0A078MRQ0_9MICC|nr:All-trans-phytoene synthase [Arthrobacter saudimassiliensis]
MATGLELYNRVAVQSSAVLIRSYSTSFGLAARLLSRPVRRHIEAIYALVRLADEIVDGVAAAAAVPAEEIERILDALEQETEQAMRTGYSVNLIVHSFALTARANGIGPELTRPFFRSMRADLRRTRHTPETFTDYVYGSAEVIGLMCLCCFLQGTATTDEQRLGLEEGARRLGAAFQKVNFLRDLADDFSGLGRSYFPGIDVERFDEADKARLLADIDADLRVSGAAVPHLPAHSRAAVALAQELFTELARRLRRTPAEELRTTRVRVPNPVKARIAAEALYAHRLRRSTGRTA